MPIPRDKLHLYRTPEARAANAAVRTRAAGRCECRGLCGGNHAHEEPSGRHSERCPELEGQRALFARGSIVITVAHLDHNPENNDAANLAALCQACHLRHDAKHHAESRSKNRDKGRGQLRLF
jgi:hypothetical protein